jgi:hypothetical protein
VKHAIVLGGTAGIAEAAERIALLLASTEP